MKCRDLSATIVLVAPTAANVEFAVAHEMDVIPRGAFILLAGGTGTLYLSTTAWDKTYAYLKSSSASGQFYVLFFM